MEPPSIAILEKVTRARAELHNLLPCGERLRREPPSVMQIHFNDLQRMDVTSHEALPITTVWRTILDCIHDDESRFAAEDLADALRKRVLTKYGGHKRRKLLR